MSDHRSSIIITDKKEILLVHRIKRNAEYFTLPGGSVEEGESCVEAAIREATEETGLAIKIDRELWQYKSDSDSRIQHIFLATEFTGVLKLGYPEIERQSEDNKYPPEWHKIIDLKTINFFPEGLVSEIINYFLNNTI
jgi:8-oxo-dGTP pyrophosphatase MutT (NUDIX family)